MINSKNLLLAVSGGWKSEITVTTRSGETPLPGHGLLMCPHVMRRARGLSGASFIRD